MIFSPYKLLNLEWKFTGYQNFTASVRDCRYILRKRSTKAYAPEEERTLVLEIQNLEPAKRTRTGVVYESAKWATYHTYEDQECLLIVFDELERRKRIYDDNQTKLRRLEAEEAKRKRDAEIASVAKAHGFAPDPELEAPKGERCKFCGLVAGVLFVITATWWWHIGGS